ncbi:MAG: carboxylesterase/lipase family protein [Candidatus Acidiferrales bacterium]
MKKSLVLPLSVCCLCLLGSCGGGSITPPLAGCVNTSTIACTQSGQVRGVIESNLRAFRGIPYAAPPVGNLRWKPPAPPLTWQGIRDASTFGNVCPQTDPNGQLLGNEDCLVLNVFTAVPTLAAPQPVMVFFHGGGNCCGDSHRVPLDSPPLATHGAVVVTAEYRLGFLGFLANPLLTAEGGGSSGNYALLDMIAVLSWVKQNIANFGGDPAHVMLFGQSAGSFNIQMLLAAPSAQGLFSAAGMESNAVPSASNAPWLISFAATEAASAPFVSAMGCNNAADVLACLRAVSTDNIVNSPSGIPFFVGSGSTFLPSDSFTALQQHGSPVPLLIGSTSEEWTAATDDPNTPLDPAGYVTEIHNEFDQFGAGVANQVLALYPATDYDTPEYALIAVHSDYQVSCEARNVALVAAGPQRPPIWRYLYTHRFENDPTLKALRAFHAAELYFVFGNLQLIRVRNIDVNYTPSALEHAFSSDMMGYWTRFAATDNPNGAGATQWLPYDAANENMLELDETFTPLNGYHTPQCNYLSTLPQP